MKIKLFQTTILIALVSIGAVFGCAHTPGTAKDKVVVIGLDSAEWNIISSLTAKGELPHFSQLMRQGAVGSMVPFPPCDSIQLWTTMITGKGPDKHGIDRWVQRDGATGKLTPMTSNVRRVKALWNILTEVGRRSIIANWYASWPAEQVNGIILSNRFGDDMSPLSYWPHTLRFEPPRPFDVSFFDSLTPFIDSRISATVVESQKPAVKEHLTMLAHEIAREEYVFNQAWQRYVKERPEVFAVIFRALDTAQHFFWKYTFPEGFKVSRRERSDLKELIFAMYRYYDRILGNVMRKIDSRTFLVVLSDHGMVSFIPRKLPAEYWNLGNTSMFFPAEGGHCIIRSVDVKAVLVHINATLQERNLPRLRWCDELFKENLAKGQNWKITLCWEKSVETSQSVGEMRGALITILKSLHSDRGKPLLSIIQRDDNDSAANHSIQVHFNPSLTPDDKFNFHGKWVYWRDLVFERKYLSGIHLDDPGIFLIKGPRVRKGFRIGAFHPQELAPTILRLLNLPEAKDMDGRARVDFLKPSVSTAWVQQKESMINTYETEGELHRVPIHSKQDQKILNRLQSLGYITVN